MSFSHPGDMESSGCAPGGGRSEPGGHGPAAPVLRWQPRGLHKDTGKRNTDTPEPFPSLCPQVQQAILMFKKRNEIGKKEEKKNPKKAEMEGKIPRSAERKPGSAAGMLSVHRPVLRDLTVLAVLARPLDQPLLSPFPHRPLGLGKGLLEGMLLGVHLLVEELRRQLSSIVDLYLHPGAASGD